MSELDFLSSGIEDLDKLLIFTAEIDKMTSVFRRTMLLDLSRRENDAEHSWHIAVMAIIFRKFFPKPVDIGRVVKMCVIHDLVEIYAGDTFAYDEQGYSDKNERESKAADKLFNSIPSEIGDELRSLWEEFDLADSDDAKYAACMDRLQPFLHNTLTEGFTWKEGKTSRSQIEKRFKIIKDSMPCLWPWIEKNLDMAIQKGWVAE